MLQYRTQEIQLRLRLMVSVKICTKRSSQIIKNNNLEHIIYNIGSQFCTVPASLAESLVEISETQPNIAKYFKISAELKLITISKERKGT